MARACPGAFLCGQWDGGFSLEPEESACVDGSQACAFWPPHEPSSTTPSASPQILQKTLNLNPSSALAELPQAGSLTSLGLSLLTCK